MIIFRAKIYFLLAVLYCAPQVWSYYRDVGVVNNGFNTFLNLQMKCNMFQEFFKTL